MLVGAGVAVGVAAMTVGVAGGVAVAIATAVGVDIGSGALVRADVGVLVGAQVAVGVAAIVLGATGGGVAVAMATDAVVPEGCGLGAGWKQAQSEATTTAPMMILASCDPYLRNPILSS